MIDIIILSASNNSLLERCLNSIQEQQSPPPYSVHIIPYPSNAKLIERPGSFYNAALEKCDYPLFTILDQKDYYSPTALRKIADFIKYKSFGLVYADSINQNSGRVNPLGDLPLTEETMWSVNPVRSPIFYNRKIVNYWCGFDHNTYSPEYDMTLKIWEKFPVFHTKQSILYSIPKKIDEDLIEDLNTVIYNAKIRGKKLFMNAGVNLYPGGLLDVVC